MSKKSKIAVVAKSASVETVAPVKVGAAGAPTTVVGAVVSSLRHAVTYVKVYTLVPALKGSQPVSEFRLKPAITVFDGIYVVDSMDYDGVNLYVRSGLESLIIPAGNIAFMRLK